MMTLEDIGYNPELEKYRQQHRLDSFDVGRVIAEHRNRYTVKTASGEYDAEVIGNLRYTAEKRSDFPAVGDWVAISEYDVDKKLIHAVYPRKSIIERLAVGSKGEKQIIASNVDGAFIVQAADRDFNVNRLERYLTICQTAGVRPLIILNKIDLVDEPALSEMMSYIRKRIPNVPVFAISNQTQKGIENVQAIIKPGETYCLLGSSGVGKSSLINTIAGKPLMHTKAISEQSNRGRHATTHRELFVLEDGGIIIDNPGMREVGIADASVGLEKTFDRIAALSEYCKFNDCSHTNETGCAVLEALANGELDESSYENYHRMEREKAHYESSVAEKRKKEKGFGKMVKQIKKQKKSTKF